MNRHPAGYNAIKMTAEAAKERRQSTRFAEAAGVHFFHAPSGREMPGRCVNLSAGGLLMYVPASAPVQPGHGVRVALGHVATPKLRKLSDAKREGEIVRVDRAALLTEGSIAVAIRFDTA